jgi:predicted SprT family Zn-dependent metalloprotease
MHMGGSGVINLNLCFVAKNADDMVNQTVPHEVVHAWLTKTGHPSHVRSYQSVQNDAYAKLAGYRTRRTKRSPHGHEFMEVLGFLGCDEKRTHNYDTSDIRTKKQNRWEWKCAKCGKVFNVTTCIHNKLRRGQIRFHPACGSVEGRLVREY